MVNPIPDGYPALTPYLCTDDAKGAIAFYGDAFGFVERMRMDQPDGKVGHCELELGDAVIMLSDEFPDHGALSPGTVGGTPVTLSLYVDDVDATAERAVAAGATVLSPLTDQFYGDRSCRLLDPFGHRWNLATHVEDVSPEEMDRRAAAAEG